MLKVIENEREGICIISEETGLQYELLELVSYHGKCTSDIVSIFVCLPEFGYLGQLDYLFGASYKDDMIDNCKELITKFENGEIKMISNCDPEDNLKEYIKHNNLKIML